MKPELKAVLEILPKLTVNDLARVYSACITETQQKMNRQSSDSEEMLRLMHKYALSRDESHASPV